MKPEFPTEGIRSRLAYPVGISRVTPTHSRLRVYCQGDKSQLQGMLDGTPFTLVDDRIAIECLDYRSCYWIHNGVRLPFSGYLSCQVTVRVQYESFVGGYFLHSYSDDWMNIMGNREFLGDPKNLADILLTETSERIDVSVSSPGRQSGNGRVIDFGADFTGHSAEVIDDFDLSNYVTVRAVPSLTKSDDFDLLQIIGIDMQTPFVESKRVHGNASVSVSSGGSIAGIQIQKVLGATYAEGELSYTAGKSPYTILYQNKP